MTHEPPVVLTASEAFDSWIQNRKKTFSISQVYVPVNVASALVTNNACLVLPILYVLRIVSILVKKEDSFWVDRYNPQCHNRIHPFPMHILGHRLELWLLKSRQYRE